MASIFTGLAFMHGHIVDKELVLALGAPCGSPLAGDGAAAEHRAQARSHKGSKGSKSSKSSTGDLADSCC